MNHPMVIRKLGANSAIFKAMLSGIPEEVYRWKPAREKWCLLEIICHLYDEEREDFRARTLHVLSTPDVSLPSINPLGWIQERKYMDRNYGTVLASFLYEREKSVHALQSFQNPNWTNVHNHPKFGSMSAEMFLANWLAHDYLHMRQITGVQYKFLEKKSGLQLNYAGNW
jgi:hypothetical protein